MSDRPSFAKNKIVQSFVGSTGITGTSKNTVEPSIEVEYSEQDGYNSSKTLFDNIDILGKKLGFENQNTFVEDVVEEDFDEYDNMSETEAAQVYMSREFSPLLYTSQNYSSQHENKELNNFCTNCGCKFNQNHHFCGKCGSKRE